MKLLKSRESCKGISSGSSFTHYQYADIQILSFHLFKANCLKSSYIDLGTNIV